MESVLTTNALPVNQPEGLALPSEHPANWLLMLDVDGTLLDIARRPDAVVVPFQLKEALLRLHDLLSSALVLISGRSIAELDTLFAPLRLPAIGSHGGEQRLSYGPVRRQLPGAQAKIAELVEACRRFAPGNPKILVERKPLSVAVHFRLDPAAGSGICAQAEALVQKMGLDWRVLHGKMVCEILPASFSKGDIVRKLVSMRRFAGRKPVFIGDDITDEPALAAVRELNGYAIRVGERADNENHFITVDDPAQLRRWLAQLAAHGNVQAASQPLRKAPFAHRPHLNGQERLIVVSNRVTLAGMHKSGSGGLAVAINAMLAAHGGVWMGWSGKISDKPTTHVQRQGDMSYIVQDLSPQEHEQFYMRFCNGTLWPLLHYKMDLPEFDRAAYESCLEVNRHYAELLKAALKPQDVIWIHDFHFIPLARFLREGGVTNRIGFFLHTPFPMRDVLLTLPVHKELMSALYAYDVVGFQTQRDLEAWRDYSMSENLRPLALHARPDTLFGHFPIGIQTASFARASEKALRSKEAQDLLASLSGRSLILGIDRLDYSKGILQRLKAVEDLLGRENGRWLKQFTFLQIAPPTREGLIHYEQLRTEVETLLGHVNGMYTDIDWVPIRFLVRGVRREILVAFYRLARICLVTPLRDGMNLVAKEFIAAQNPADPGVLILSRFAGAAEELHQAVLVNPYDAHEIADAIEQALTMPLAERRERWRAMYNTISHQTLEKWSRDFLTALSE